MKRFLVLLLLFSFGASTYSKAKYTKDEAFYISEICKSVEAYQIAVEKGWSSKQSQARGKLSSHTWSLRKSQPDFNQIDYKYKGKTLVEWLNDYENQQAVLRAAYNKEYDAQKKKGEDAQLVNETVISPLDAGDEPEFGIDAKKGIEINIDAHLASWEANNASKKMEDIGSDSINSLLADINNVIDPEKQSNFLKRFEDALLVLAGNSLSDWRNTDIDYFSRYCMTQTFQSTVARFSKYYDLFDGFGASNDNAFEMLKDEIVKIINVELESSFGEWILIMPTCDAIDAPVYVKCAETYANFIIETTTGHFNRRAEFSFDNNIMQEVGEKISMLAQVSMMEAECDCVKVCKNILTEYFEEDKSSLISELNTFLSEHCERECPCLWNIQFTQDYSSSESSELFRYRTNITFENVFIYPRGDYQLSDQEREACADFIDERGRAINTSATSYWAVEEDYEYLEQAPVFMYVGLSPDRLEDTRDYKCDIPFDRLSPAYKKGVDGVLNDHHRDGWPRLSNDGYHFRGYTDIFEEIYLHEAFTVGDKRGTFIFTPVGSR